MNKEEIRMERIYIDPNEDDLEIEDAGRDVGESVFVLDGDGVTIARVPDDLDVEGDETDA